MRAVVQRVAAAAVTVGGEEVGRIGPGVVVLLGVGGADTEADAEYLAGKVAHLRIFEDGDRNMNLSLLETGGQALVVSQFTLYGDCRKGRRPSFTEAAPPGDAERLYESFTARLREQGIGVETGRFQAMMQVEIHNDGPVTILLDSKKIF